VTDKIVVLTTCPSAAEAEAIARRLVERRLAVCVSLVSGARSFYHWQGAIEESEEILLVIKSRRDIFQRLQIELSTIHSYEVPEVVALQIVEGSSNYLAWMERELPEVGASE
jgi:periplasmic divalent cation tolerance protein